MTLIDLLLEEILICRVLKRIEMTYWGWKRFGQQLLNLITKIGNKLIFFVIIYLFLGNSQVVSVNTYGLRRVITKIAKDVPAKLGSKIAMAHTKIAEA